MADSLLVNAILYIVFAICFASVNLLQLTIPASYQVNQVLRNRFLSIPSLSGTFITNITSTEGVGEWMASAFLKALYTDEESPFDIQLGVADQSRPLPTVGFFNVLLTTRLSLKRHRVEKNTLAPKDVKGFYPRIIGRQRIDPSTMNLKSFSLKSHEDTASFDGASTGQTYTYSRGRGYSRAGGFIEYVNLDGGEAAMHQRIEELRADGWFEASLASFVADMYFYNANLQKFFHFAVVFQAALGGTISHQLEGHGFTLELYDMQASINVFRLFLEIVVIVCYLYFVGVEVKAFVEGPVSYLQSGVFKAVDVVQLTLNGIYISMHIFMISQRAYWTLKLPIDQNNLESSLEQLDALLTSASLNSLVGVNICLVFFRTLSLMSDVSPTYGLVINTIGQGAGNLVWFSLMFFIIFLGFVWFGFFTFGGQLAAMGTFNRTVLACFTMLLGKSFYQEMMEIAPTIAPIYFYSFVTFFVFILLNMFLSIIMSAYDLQIYRIEKMSLGERGALTKVIKELGGYLSRRFAWTRPAFRIISVLCRPKPRSAAELAEAREQAEKIRAKRQSREQVCSIDCLGILVFMALFIAIITIQARTTSSYRLMEVQDFVIERPQWPSSLNPINPTTNQSLSRDVNHASIAIMDHIYEWTVAAVGNELYRSGDVRDVDAKSSRPPRGNSLESVYLNRYFAWNVGFMPEAFVRMTFQPACYKELTESRWRGAYPVIRVTRNAFCADNKCATKHPSSCPSDVYDLSDSTNLSAAWGDAYPAESIVKFSSARNTYRQKGGFSVSLGKTQKEALERVGALRRAKVFSARTASIVFDYVTYNGNVDMFTYNTARFSLRASGMIQVKRSSQSFPLNPYTGGGWYQPLRILTAVLGAVYVLFVIYYIVKLVKEIQRHRIICIAEKDARVNYVVDFYRSDAWNISDAVSLCLSVLTIAYYARFSLDGFCLTYNWTDWTMADTVFRTLSSPRKESIKTYVLDQMGNISRVYYMFLLFGACNTYFVSIRVLKYLNLIPQLRLQTTTIQEVANQIITMIIMQGLLLFGFAMLFHVKYGSHLEEFSTSGIAFLTLFRFAVGDVQVDRLYEVDAAFTLVFFILYMTFFYFIIVNVFLAAIMSKYYFTYIKFEDSGQLRSLVDYWNDAKDIFNNSPIVESASDWLKKRRQALRKALGYKAEGVPSHLRAVAGHSRTRMGDLQRRSAFSILERQADKVGYGTTRPSQAPSRPDTRDSRTKDRGEDESEGIEGDGQNEIGDDPLAGMTIESRFTHIRKLAVGKETEQHMKSIKDVKDRRADDQEDIEDREALQEIPPDEFWLDALITSLEGYRGTYLLREVCEPPPEDSLWGDKGQQKIEEQRRQVYEERVDRVHDLLQMKAKAQYHTSVGRQSVLKQRLVKHQTAILNHYSCELERKLADVEAKIASYDHIRQEYIRQMEPMLDSAAADVAAS
ncbi:unnamed protein product [Vitrella brassicaformis CCMP3155]|uniref:Polycystin cation channel PKD1/PKD2 domain-containing protein n=2 Tax=Vitrella brassicaformis TaxID=1169539 RepID=A0A0G4ECN2_VITBC|nr:unnamed protein product [Vitrella brassicaformis CCMP3155]|mmetsp:Transcript_18407/g.44305  ORF Transcript_18407/g.44305 Transcript_18407/m.44305 type:complete len:1441 (+) Transcript_18407:108-4430(+)|eukprot:CEL93302.1 unnamed protein product [Vitrella brassicaformis CCMP3155]